MATDVIFAYNPAQDALYVLQKGVFPGGGYRIHRGTSAAILFSGTIGDLGLQKLDNEQFRINSACPFIGTPTAPDLFPTMRPFKCFGVDGNLYADYSGGGQGYSDTPWLPPDYLGAGEHFFGGCGGSIIFNPTEGFVKTVKATPLYLGTINTGQIDVTPFLANVSSPILMLGTTGLAVGGGTNFPGAFSVGSSDQFWVLSNATGPGVPKSPIVAATGVTNTRYLVIPILEVLDNSDAKANDTFEVKRILSIDVDAFPGVPIFPNPASGTYLYDFFWCDTRSELIALSGGYQFIFEGAEILPDKAQDLSVLPGYSANGGFYLNYDYARNLYVYHNEQWIVTVSDPQDLVVENSVHLPDLVGANQFQPDIFGSQQVLAGTMAFIANGFLHKINTSNLQLAGDPIDLRKAIYNPNLGLTDRPITYNPFSASGINYVPGNL